MAERRSGRRLLHRIDALLEEVEQLRLRGVRDMPERLRAEVARVAAELDRRDVRGTATVAGAHSCLFNLQGLLMHGRRERDAEPAPPPALARAARIPSLALPQGGARDAEWEERVRLVLQRAHDRARLLDAQAKAAGRLSGAEGQALADARAHQATQARQACDDLSAAAVRVLGRVPALDPAPVLPTRGRLEMEGLVIDLDAGNVRQRGRTVPLTTHERSVLVAIVANRGRVVTREAVMHLVHGDRPEVDLRSRALDVHLGRIRARLGDPAYLETVVGIGFRAAAPPSATPMSPSAGADPAARARRDQRRAWAHGASAAPARAARPVLMPQPTRRPGP